MIGLSLARPFVPGRGVGRDGDWYWPLARNLESGVSGIEGFTCERASARTRVNPDTGMIETLPVNTPAFEAEGLSYSPGGTNLIPYSEDFTWWTPAGLPVLTTDLIAPDGTFSGVTLTDNNTQSNSLIVSPLGVVSGTVATVSLYVKYINSPVCSIMLRDATAPVSKAYVRVTWTNGIPVLSVDVVGTPILHPVQGLGNGWFRVSFSNTVTPGNAHSIYVYPVDRNVIALTGSTGIWGAQLTQTSFPLPYIPTNGSPVTVARDDIKWTLSAGLKNILSDLEGDATSEGTMVVDVKFPMDDTRPYTAYLVGHQWLYRNATQGSWYVYDGVVTSGVLGSVGSLGTSKFYVSWSKSGSHKTLGSKTDGTWLHGTVTSYDGSLSLASLSMPIGLNTNMPFHIKNIRFFSEAKSQAWIEANF